MFNRARIVLLLGLIVSPGFAQYEISRYTINNGGQKMSGGNYTILPSTGQADASTTKSDATLQTQYTLNGGFWHQIDTSPIPELIFSNSFE